MTDLADLLHGTRPYALLRREGAGHVEVLIGQMTTAPSTGLIPLDPGTPTLALLPHRQIAERGFAAVDDGEPLLCLVAAERGRAGLPEVLAALPEEIGEVTDLGFDIADDAYAEIVGRVLAEEIGRGEGSNFVIHRTRQAQVADERRTALACLRRLLRRETGAYWTFLVYTGTEYFVGASPERHVSHEAGLVMMNPISGTYRHPASGPDRAGLLRFLADPKEVNELAMVLDEELKMMAVVADGGGQVVGPYLKEMAHLAHTEYLLAGRGSLDVRDVLRETMFAPTVTGSPIENACRVIARHEQRGRGYYGGVVALLDHDDTGTPRLDSTILIRTARIGDGLVRVPVGATLVRDSTPDGEVAETHAKAAGVLAALGLVPASSAPAGAATRFADDPDVVRTLAARNDRLSPFWLADRTQVTFARPFEGRTCVIVDAEDTFTGMLAHMLRSLGMTVSLQAYKSVEESVDADLVVAGPGPGDPTDPALASAAALRRVIRRRLADRKPLLAVCLGHQVLAQELGLTLHRREVPAQGLPIDADLFGTVRRVGYYSTFTALTSEVDGVRLAAGPDGFVHALRGPRYAGVQFHPESVLTEDGPGILTALITDLLAVEPVR
ncbi:MAG: chorismate-binding protein [Hamadaea sp.]|uniref:chorismate-binding protein n=1 Tax=Hamadaea sp. TaxID=2024425 RepID=UPI00183B0D43|nr:chorismate-binding protein [Hamadaea sp.]NUR74228.1 chorismate-binding protein [Hamadaea sp.]NUT22262.1 chorismate-binding protein [Hamadaea sp.]